MEYKPAKCDVCATPYFERNNYFYGKQFTVRDLIQEQSYFNEKRRLVNRMVLGWGVVCGLDVEWDEKKHEFIVGTGMALDCCGREIIICEPQRVVFEQYDDECGAAQDKYDYESKFVLCLDYHECNAEPVTLPPVGCDEQERTEYNRIRDGFKLSIREWENACPKQPYDHIACLNRFKHDVTEAPEDHDCNTETIHQHLCGYLKGGCPECEGCDCVVLGTIYVEAAKSEQYKTKDQPAEAKEYKPEYEPPPVKVWIDTCTDRRFVYQNSLLYDLIYCHHGDLPHIVDFSWRPHAYPNREIDIDTFLKMMKDGLTVYFDREMNPDSLNPHTFIVVYLKRDTGTGVFVENRLPVKEIKSGWIDGCYATTFVATDRWIKNELDTDDSELRSAMPNVEAGVNIEITLRGSRIWSTDGKGLDGDYLADKLPTGNGTQGGDFVDWFRIVTSQGKKPAGEPYKDF